jgi:pimeloyl-ACP methyl ester carboxylesterase
MPELTANGCRFFYQRIGPAAGRGAEPTAVFVHGLVMDNLSSWWYTVATRAARHADVLCYDLRGHGMSERTPQGYSVLDSVDDLAGILDVLGIDHPVHLIGNSYGGVVGLAFARAFPERAASLVLLEAHAAVEGLDERDADMLAHGLDLAGTLLDDTVVNRWLDHIAGRKLNRMAARAKDLLTNTSLVDDLRASPPFTGEELEALTCPTLLLFGEHSDIFTRAQLLERLIPHAELHVLEGIDHTALMSATPQVRELIIDWLAAHAVAGTGSPGSGR